MILVVILNRQLNALKYLNCSLSSSYQEHSVVIGKYERLALPT